MGILRQIIIEGFYVNSQKRSNMYTSVSCIGINLKNRIISFHDPLLPFEQTIIGEMYYNAQASQNIKRP